MKNLMSKVLVSLIGIGGTVAAQKAVTATWSAVVGEEPPDPNDPEVPTVVAASWAIASAVGLTLVQLLISRYVDRRWAQTARHGRRRRSVAGS